MGKRYWGLDVIKSVLIPHSQSKPKIYNKVSEEKNGFQLRKMAIVCVLLLYKQLIAVAYSEYLYVKLKSFQIDFNFS